MKKLLLAIFALPLLVGCGYKSSDSAINNAEPALSNRWYRSAVTDFTSYWETFRETHPAVCDITFEEFKEMYSHYLALSKEDRAIVDGMKDPKENDYTIGSIIRTLVNKFYPNNSKIKTEKEKLNQSTIIVIATIVALVGATSISILYILKNNTVLK